MTGFTPLILTCIPLFGIPFLVGFFLPQENIGWPSRWWFGIISIGLLLIVIHGTGIPKTGTFCLMTFFLLLSFLNAVRCLWRRHRQNKKDFISSVFWQTLVPVLFFLPILGSAYLHILSYPVTPSDWDAIAIWYRKIKLLYAWAPLTNSPLADWGGLYLNYPNLGPMLEALIIRFTGSLVENYGRLLMPTLYFFWMLAFNYFYPAKARGAYALLIAFLGILFFDEKSFTNGYQEGFVAALAGMAAVHFCRILCDQTVREKNSPKGLFEPNHFLGFFFAGALCFVKNEASVLAVIIVSAFLATYFLTHPVRKSIRYFVFLIPYLVIFITLLCLWPFLLKLNHADLAHFQGKYLTSTNIPGLYKNLNRWPIIWPRFTAYFQENRAVLSSALWLSALAAACSPKSRRALLFLGLILSAHLLFVALPYFATGANPVWHLNTSFSRLMFQHFFVYPIMLGIVGSFLADKLVSRVSKPSQQVPSHDE